MTDHIYNDYIYSSIHALLHDRRLRIMRQPPLVNTDNINRENLRKLNPLPTLLNLPHVICDIITEYYDILPYLIDMYFINVSLYGLGDRSIRLCMRNDLDVQQWVRQRNKMVISTGRHREWIREINYITRQN